MKILLPRKNILKRLLGISLIFLLVSAISLRFLSSTVDAAWFDENFAYRKAIILTGSGAEANKYATLSAYDASDIAKYQSDCGDIRFTDAGGKLLKYTISSCGASTTFHINMESIIDGTQTIYLYYGNPSVPNGFIATDPYSACSGCSFGSPASEEKAPQPLAYWAFDESSGTTAHDSTTNKHTVALAASSATPTWIGRSECISGSCLKFDGVDDYASSSANIDLTSTAVVTVEFWMNWKTYADDDSLAMEFSQNINNTTDGFFVDPNANTGVMIASLKGDVGTNDAEFARPKAGWHHYAFVYDKSQPGATEIVPYIDGVAVSYAKTFSANNTNNFGNEVLNFMSRGGVSLFGGGLMDEVKLYPYTRSAAQIKADYNAKINGNSSSVLGADMNSAGPGGLSQGIVHYYKFDETSWTNDCSTKTVKDSAGAADLISCPNSSGPTTPGVGKYGNAGMFDGSDDQVDASFQFAESYDKRWTVSEWFKTLDTQAYLFDTRDNAYDSDHNGVAVFTDGADTFTFYQQINNVNTKYYTYTSATLDGNWHHLVVTRDGDNSISFYIDRTKLIPASVTADSDIRSSAEVWAGIHYGNRNYGNVYALNGSIDEARLYSRAFSQNDVNKLYDFAPGPVGYWNLDEKSGNTANDSSGNGNTGTWNGSGRNFVTGKLGGAGGFDGSTDYINAGNPGLLQITSDITLSAWVNPSAINGSKYYPILGKRDSDGVHGYELYLPNDNSGDLAYYTDGTEFKSSYVLPLNKWTYVTAAISGGTLTLYANGVPVYTNTGATPSSANGNFYIGLGLSSEPANIFAGKIDDAKVYNYARSSKQIIEDMNGGHPAGGSPVGSQVAYWDMDEGYGTAAHDRTPNRKDLTLSSASWTNSGKMGKAWNGTGSIWLSRPDDDALDFGSGEDVTLSLWAKSDSASNPGVNEFLITKQTATNNPGYRLRYNTSGQLVCEIDDDTSSFPEDSATTSTDFYDGTWHHILCSRNITTNTLDLYVDGKLAGQDTSLSATGSLANNSTFYVGDDDGDSTNSFAGDIDEVKIYRSALSSDERKIDMNGNASQVLGAAGNNSTYAGGAANQEYCLPGDSTPCAAPIGEWKFEERQGGTVNDTSSSGNTGTWNGTGTNHWVNGKIGKAGNFNGSDDDISVSDASSLDVSGTITVSAWIKPITITSRMVYASKTDASGNEAWLLEINPIDCSNGQLNFFLKAGGSSGNTCSNTALTAGQWAYVTAVYDGTNKYIYINGVLDKTDAKSGAISTNNVNVYIGAWGALNSRWWSGSIDQVRIYDYARSSAQIAWEYNKGAPVAYWDMDECQGGVVHDLSGNGFDGTLTVGPLSTQTGLGDCVTSNAAAAWYNGRVGKFNSSLNLDGRDDYVTVSGTVPGKNSAGSYSTWIKTSTDYSGNEGIILYGCANGSCGNGFGAEDEIHMQIDTTNTAGLYVDGGSNSGITVTSSKVVNDGQWHNVTSTWSMSGGTLTATLYVDGTRVGSNTGSATEFSLGPNFTVGQDSSASRRYTGQVDETRVFNYPLTSTQVKILYTGGAVRFGPAAGTP